MSVLENYTVAQVQILENKQRNWEFSYQKEERKTPQKHSIKEEEKSAEIVENQLEDDVQFIARVNVT